MTPLTRQHLLPLDRICQEDFLDREGVDYLLQHPAEEPGCDLQQVQRYVADIQAGNKPLVDVFLERGTYRILVGDRELASAYHYNGWNEIPVNILPPDDPAIPAYVRKGVSIDPSPREAWN